MNESKTPSQMKNESISNGKASYFLQRPLVVFFGAMIACALWGSAFPAVKIGMKMFEIESINTGDQLLFAGLRFVLAGFLVIAIGSLLEKQVLLPKKGQGKIILAQSFFQTVGQYSFYYIGIAHASGSSTAVVNSASKFLAILFAAYLFRLEQMNLRKILGCLLGFSGIIIQNITGLMGGVHMTLLGEGLILLSATISSMASSTSKIFTRKINPVTLSGYQFMVGGALLSAIGFLAGGTIKAKTITPGSLILFVYLALISTIAYTIWTILLKYNEVSHVSIYGFMNPVFGVLFSAIFLKEYKDLGFNYLVALIIISVAIILINKPEKNR